jgi:hypothetical protein
VSASGPNAVGTQSSGPAAVKSKAAGITPTTAYRSALSSTVRPSTAGLAPKLRRQSRWLSTTTFGAPRRSSSGAKPRPSAGRTPNTAK